jgi:hypothetical protein
MARALGIQGSAGGLVSFLVPQPKRTGPAEWRGLRIFAHALGSWPDRAAPAGSASAPSDPRSGRQAGSRQRSKRFWREAIGSPPAENNGRQLAGALRFYIRTAIAGWRAWGTRGTEAPASHSRLPLLPKSQEHFSVGPSLRPTNTGKRTGVGGWRSTREKLIFAAKGALMLVGL